MTPSASGNRGSAANRARERAAAARAEQARIERRRRTIRCSAIGGAFIIVAAIVVVIAITAGGGSKKATTTPSPTSTGKEVLGPEAIPIEQGVVLAPASTAASGQPVDGIKCQSAEQVAYHIHAHLAVFDNGQLRPIPLGIGIVKPVVQQTPTGGFAQASNCYYWLHTHVQDGVIHIESPTKTIYTLGQFFDEWKQPLTNNEVATVQGKVTAYVNGKPYTGDLRSIPLTAHATIQLDIGTPSVAPQPVDWSKSSL
jgi:hypothetical protein